MSEANLDAKLKTYRLSKDEYEMITRTLGRPPAGLEWALFSALWSEHCSYKSSRVHLKKFAMTNARVLEGMGENAGVIDLGHGERVAFKMESHNHPSFIEPYQGAATGVGGILRDIFTMGARPIALANYLCFGDPNAERMSALVDGVVSGIAGYGNCVGVPMITGQTNFDRSYDGNILVNALAVGLFTADEPMVTSHARGPGNLVVYVGAKTGRDGVHGASMASESFAADSAAKRPTVQIGDPFFEKLLIESCLEVIQRGLVVAIQDMGAAGLTSSSFEMAAKGGVGLDLDLTKVPLRDSSVGPEEILLSESQERMLLVCEPGQFDAIHEVFTRWGLDASVLGHVTAEPEVTLRWRGETLCRIDPKLLTDSAPAYDRPYAKWTAPRRVERVTTKANRVTDQLASVEGCARTWIYRQYDQRVGARTVRDCADPVGVVRLPSGRGLGLTLGCRPEVMRIDAEVGAYDAALYPALCLAARGFTPLAMTDCLNFGNPERPPVMSEFVASVEALAHAARALDAPVISGNVSFYNETLGQNVTSTPATGVVGLRDDVERIPQSRFVRAGDHLVLLRLPMITYGGDAFSGQFDVTRAAAFVREVTTLVNSGVVNASRVSGRFGLGYALARMGTPEFSAVASSKDLNAGPHAFAEERLYDVIVAGGDDLLAWTNKYAGADSGARAIRLGHVAPGPLTLDHERFDQKELDELYVGGWRTHFPGLS